jgi:hypothetical protein
VRVDAGPSLVSQPSLLARRGWGLSTLIEPLSLHFALDSRFVAPVAELFG